MECDYHEWCKVTLRFFRGDSSARNCNYKKGIWRCVRCHELETHRCRHELCMANGGNRRDGSEGRSGDHFQKGDLRISEPHRETEREGRRVYTEVRQSLSRGSSWLYR